MGEILNGTWIQTYTGKQFLTMDARPEEVFPLDDKDFDDF